jgi:hypothetical protein
MSSSDKKLNRRQFIKGAATAIVISFLFLHSSIHLLFMPLQRLIWSLLKMETLPSSFKLQWLPWEEWVDL